MFIPKKDNNNKKTRNPYVSYMKPIIRNMKVALMICAKLQNNNNPINIISFCQTSNNPIPVCNIDHIAIIFL